MSSSAASRHASASGRRLTPPRFEEVELPSTFESLTPLRQYTSASVIEETENGNDYLDVFAEVTDADEVFAEQWESGATEQSTTPPLKRIDSFDFVTGGVNVSSSIAKTRTMSTIATLEPVKEDKQPACASYCRAPAYVELLFDAETPYASDEDLANRREDFVLADKYDDFSLSLRYPTAKDIFELIDELVDVDMFDMEDGFGNSTKEPPVLLDTSFATSPDMDAFVACGPLLYSPTLDDVSDVCDKDNVSETSETNEEPGLSPPRYAEIAYVDAETHKCVAYTALNQLLSMQEDLPRPVIHRDIPDDEDHGSAELKEHSCLNLEDQGRKSRISLRDDPCPSRFWSDFTSGIGHPPAPPQTSLQRQSAVRQQCLPFGLYSSNLPHHQRRFPRLTLATQLVPASEPLSTVDEEQLSWLSPSSSGDSVGFADYRGFAKPIEERQQGFSDDEDEEGGTYVEHGLEAPMMPSSPPHLTCDDMFTDVVWDSAPDLTLTQPHCEPHAAATITSRIPSAPLLEAFETEVHTGLTFIFSCMNDGRYDELPVLCNDLHWTLCALAHDYPAMAVLDSLGAAVEILAERIIASTPAS
ncbi:uncharacterized protein J4E78_004737 [Alternaria triticimaculans]|uniref:uncharacterized protein n=1 Tax=Alternaria triticimaculans TaxID=297637 RepID=UPI0020C251B1|nr:uncharacterized protein J4E78_004737 [Alternaria triticimaculans]KAI4661947.1 hypothetical protein J4E78_004737 [Alternaria triticimaculans]